MYTPLKIAMASALALATAAPALAQPSSSYQPTEQYQQNLSKYQNDRAAYDATAGDYQAAKRDYDRRRADWERARTDYDARYGYGAYLRSYGPEPVWDEAHWRDGYPRAAGVYGRDTAYTGSETCRTADGTAVTAGVIGALAGAALGSNVAGRNSRSEGAVLGAFAGGAVGVSAARASGRFQCDAGGPYYAYRDTLPYRESADFRSGRYDYRRYSDMRCRLAAAPIDPYARDYRYVRVCPDGDGRYRITG